MSNRREFIKTTSSASAALFLTDTALQAAQKEPSLERPNILLVMADDQGWGDCGYNGHEILKTPNLDAMAAASLRLDRFYAAAPVCSPTRANILTGRHPNRFGCFRWGLPIRPQETTIAHKLKKADYITAHFGKWHVGSVQKNGTSTPGQCGFDEWLSAPNFFDNDPILSREGTAEPQKGESSAVTVKAALEFIKKHKDKPQPFFAAIWFGSVHSPHISDETFAEPYATFDDKKKNFYGELAGIDSAVGTLRAALRDMDIAENTLVWYCSDNGGLRGLGHTGGRGHKGDIYEGGLRIPGIMEWPAKINSPRTTSVPCSTSDIYPTLLDIVDIPIDDQRPRDGISLVGLINGELTTRPKPLFFWKYLTGGINAKSLEWMKELYEAQQQGKEVDIPLRLYTGAELIKKQYPADFSAGHAALLDWPWKFHRIVDKKKGLRFELYNLAQDPNEEKDVVAEHPEMIRAMKIQISDWQASVVNSLNGKDY